MPGGEGSSLLEQLIPAGAALGGPGRLLGFLFLPWLRISRAGVDIRSGGNRHPVAPRVIHSGVAHHRQHVVERRHPPRSRRRHDAIAPRLSRSLWPAAARPATTSHERLISLCKSLNCSFQATFLLRGAELAPRDRNDDGGVGVAYAALSA